MKKVMAPLIGAVALAGICAPPASAAATLGQTFDPEPCNANFTRLQSVSPGAPFHQYEAPSAGVITSWRFQADASPPQLKFKVGRPAVGADFTTAANFTVIGESALVTPVASSLNIYAAQIPVLAGDVIGLHTLTAGNCRRFDTSYTQHDSSGDVLPPTMGTFARTPDLQLNVSAILEPDADGDGFGDETQDQCPTDASTQGPCSVPDGDGDGVPDASDECPSVSGPASNQGCPVETDDIDPPKTTITKGAPNRIKRSKVKFKFESNEAGSTFECKVDKKPFKPCESPKKVKRLDQGKHKFKVRATDPAGNVDPTPDKDKFKVVG